MHAYPTRHQKRSFHLSSLPGHLSFEECTALARDIELRKERGNEVVRLRTTKVICALFHDRLVPSLLVPWSKISSQGPDGMKRNYVAVVESTLHKIWNSHTEFIAKLDDVDDSMRQLSCGGYTFGKVLGGYSHNRGACMMLVMLGVIQLALLDNGIWQHDRTFDEVMESMLRHLHRMTCPFFVPHATSYSKEIEICRRHIGINTTREYGWYMSDIAPFILASTAVTFEHAPLHRLCTALVCILNSKKVDTDKQLLRALRRV